MPQAGQVSGSIASRRTRPSFMNVMLDVHAAGAHREFSLMPVPELAADCRH